MRLTRISIQNYRSIKNTGDITIESLQALVGENNCGKNQFKGNKLHLLLNKHPYADAMIADLDNFKKMTGMEVLAAKGP